ncbi:Predicted ATPase, nucleotide-binding [Plasmopara halstedii]|uniref:Predicted ATPase, nucleotide-binding n=1 Tax=Plasmopara halstedii TaxID=4781 RepID=A0A0N7L5Z8_PLAHL|nr:Predicted ATPase, nucleotide-binding [Plasmopara halstedii]CEG42875.1 Predicted ATPase, nucleotide-binding [Plasmopara halstedii]|eukprot:XP_024579244.1 Predicted ATPase, nucleotide-binding [Plasmopara halstedii]
MLRWKAGRSALLRDSRCALSTRRVVELETQVLEKLRNISDGLGLGDIVSMGRIKELHVEPEAGKVSCKISTPSPVLMDLSKKWQKEAELAVKELEWVKVIDFKLSNPRPRNAHVGRFSSLAHVSEIIAVSSCKGGVGKSTVAVNLAFSLSKYGARVGILDADIYGPSLPTMVSPGDRTIRQSKKIKNFVEPVEYEGVKCMSFGFVNQRAAPGAGGVGAAVMRGPMVSKLIDQLILGTEWGDLDYLVVDMPPGTGDIQISISQQMPISAAVVVTTPQRLSFVDVEKGISMFEDLKVKTAAVVENMSYFDCCHGQRHYPFGSGHTQELVEKYSIHNIFKLPIAERISSAADSGRPFVLSELSTEESKTYDSLATTIAKEVVIMKHNIRLAPELLYDKNRGIVLRMYNSTEAKEALLHPADFRARCRCAQCIDEFTGDQILDPATISDDIYPTTVERKGNYAFAVTWSDEHSSSLYTVCIPLHSESFSRIAFI